MRNHLAEEALDKDMLYLMQQYQNTLQNSTYVENTVELLMNTNKFIEIFRNPRPIINISDKRLQTLAAIEKWLDEWNSEVSDLDIPSSEKTTFLSKKTYSDTISLLSGFRELCERRINQQQSITPADINSNIVEIFFCQPRATYHGSNTNPSIHQYQIGINSTVLGQSAYSKKAMQDQAREKLCHCL